MTDQLVPPTSKVFDLPHTALAIRGGFSLPVDLWRSARTIEVRCGRPALSIYAATEAPLVDLASVQSLEVYKVVRRVSLESLDRSGFWVQKTLGPRHYTVWLHELSDAVIDEFAESLSDPEPKPALPETVPAPGSSPDVEFGRLKGG